jgi:hypothetical protein
MSIPAPEDFWRLVAASRLVPPDVLDALHREHVRETVGQPPAADSAAATTAIAKWLIQRGVLSKWQGRRLLTGDSGPFFVGGYRLIERLENDGPGRLFRGRHEPSGRRVCLMVLDRKLSQRPDVWAEIVRRTTAARSAVDPTLGRGWTVEEVQGNRFIVCDDADGMLLADELARLVSFPPANATAGGMSPAALTEATPLTVHIRTGPAADALANRRVAQKRAARLGLVCMGIAGGLVAVVLAVTQSQSRRSTAPHTPPGQASVVEATGTADRNDTRQEPSENSGHLPESPATTQPADEAVSTAPPVTIVDSAELPWASPTVGRPPSLSYLPPGSQLILLARPAELMADDEGRQFVKSLGPRVADGITVLNTLCRCGLDNVAELQVGWQTGGSDTATAVEDVVAGWTVRFQEPSPLREDVVARAGAWGETEERNLDGETIHVGQDFSFWLPVAEEGRVLVMAPTGLLETMVEAARSAGPEEDGETLVASLPQDLEQLVGMLDRTRHLTLLGSPHYLVHDGRSLMTASLAGIVESLGRFFGDGVRVAALSLHCADNFYAEVDVIASRAEPANLLADRLTHQIEAMADAVEDACAAINPHPYGRKLVMRLPAMIRALVANTRCGAEGKGVVLNAYLPRHAGHNLMLAAELAIEQSQEGVVGAVAVSKTPTAVSGGVAASLQKRISLVFAAETLEKAIQMLSDEIGMPMEILGGDLQLDGITKNQSFGLEERDTPAEAVLRTILARSDSAGRLVYVVRMRDGVESIEITTRSAVAKRGDPLPPGL